MSSSVDEAAWLAAHPHMADDIAIDLRYARALLRLKPEQTGVVRARIDNVASMLLRRWSREPDAVRLETVLEAIGVYHALGVGADSYLRLRAVAVLLSPSSDRGARAMAMAVVGDTASLLTRAREARRVGRFREAGRLLGEAAARAPTSLSDEDRAFLQNLALYADVEYPLPSAGALAASSLFVEGTPL